MKDEIVLDGRKTPPSLFYLTTGIIASLLWLILVVSLFIQFDISLIFVLIVVLPFTILLISRSGRKVIIRQKDLTKPFFIKEGNMISAAQIKEGF